MEQLNEITEEIGHILKDTSIPKSVRKVLETAQKVLQEEKEAEIKIAKVMELLDDINDNNDVPSHLRTQVWSLVSTLEHTQHIS